MDNVSTVALSRMMAQQRALEVIAGNLANADTPGYHAERVQFSDWLVREPGTTSPPGAATIAYTQDRATWREQTPGTLSHTGNPLDLALAGPGYFTVVTAAGPRLTRAGRFSVDASGQMVDSTGAALLDADGRKLRLDPTDTRITVAADGTISSENGVMGRIGVVQPDDPMRLSAEGGHDLRADTPTSPIASPQITQGALEESGVQPIMETTRMMDLQRQFEFASQFIQAESDRAQNTIEKLTPHAS